MKEAEEKNMLRRNLTDGGCNEQTVERFLKFHLEGKRREELRLLNLQRAALLDALHGEQSRIECLDYLIYSIKNQSNSKEIV